MTLINGFNLVHYLLSKGLINYDEIFKQGLSIKPVQSRNFSFMINIPNASSLFVKQVDFPEAEKIETLKMEATCYWLAQNDKHYTDLKDLFPEYISYDQFNHILISQFFTDSKELYTYIKEQGVYEVEIAKKLASILSSYHNGMYSKIKEQSSERLFRKSIPGPFKLFGKDLNFMKARTQVEKQMKDLILSQEGFKEKVNLVKDKWQVNSLIHGDIKFQNFLIQQNEGAESKIKLIDWEIADLGDAMWDCAAVLQSYILPWIMHNGHDEAPQLFKNMESALPSIHAFWSNYSMRTKLEASSLVKLIEFTAVKLLHTCYESNVYAKSLSAAGANMLQLSLNMLTNPVELMTEFFEFQKYEYESVV